MLVLFPSSSPHSIERGCFDNERFFQQSTHVVSAFISATMFSPFFLFLAGTLLSLFLLFFAILFFSFSCVHFE